MDYEPEPFGVELLVPQRAWGVVIFAHGSGSGRHSPRNQWVASEFRKLGLATVLFDLLTPAEAANRQLVFQIDFLAGRLSMATDWVRNQEATRALPIGYFGASTGGAACLAAAAERDDVGAVVSRGGRPDLAAAWLAKVRAPTLLLVGSEDREVLRLNQAALARLDCEKRLRLVVGAGHLFEEPGTLEAVARAAAEWFEAHLKRGRHVPGST